MEEELQSLTDQLDGLVSQMAENGERPEGVYSAVEQFRLAMREGSEKIRDAVEDIGGDAEVSSVEDGIEEQADRILPDEEFSPEQVLAQELAIEEGLEVEDTLGEEAVESVENSLETEAAEIGEGFQQIAEDADTLNDVFNALTESSAISNEALQGLQPTFEGLQSEVEQTIQEVEQGAATLSEGQNQIAKISEQAQEALRENIEGQFENVEGVGQELEQVVSKFFQNAQSQMGATAAAQEAGVPDIGQALEIGTILNEQFGDSDFLKGISGAVDTAMAPITNPQVGSFTSKMQEAQEASGGIAAIWSKVKSAISASRVALAAFISPLIFAVDLIEDAFGAARDFRKETGIGAERMRELREVTANTSAELAKFGLSPGDASEIFGGLQEQFGSLRSAVQLTGAETEEQLVKQVGALSQGFAMSASEAAKLFGSLKEIEMTTGASAGQLASATKEIARQNDVAPKAAMQDIAENSEKLAKFSSASAQRLASAAVEAQRLGTSLESVTSFQEQALSDMTGQVQKLQKASMLTGQQFNSQALIQASFEGTEATVDEIGEQLEGIDVSSLNYFQKESLSSAFGMSVSEIEQISQGRKALQDLNTTAERSKALSEGDVTFQQAVIADDVDEVKNLTKTFNQLYFVMAEELFPVITDLTQAVLPALTATLKFARPLLEGFAEGVRLILSPLQLLTGNFKGFKETMNEAMQPFRNLFGMMEEGEEKANKLAAAGKALAITFATYFGGSKIISGIQGITGSLTEMLPALTKASGTANSFAGNMDLAEDVVNQNISSFKNLRSSFTSLIPSIQRVKAGFRLARSGISKFVFQTIPSLIPSLAGIQTAMYNAAASTYTFAAGLSATGIGAIILGIAAAGTALYYAFEDVNSALTFATSFFNSFVEELFGVQNASSQLTSILQNLYDWTIAAFSELGSFLSPLIGGVGKLAKGFFDAKTTGEALGSTLGLVFETLFDPLVDGITLIGQVIDLFYDLGAAISEGSWKKATSALLEGVVDIGGAFIDFLIPYNLEEIFPKMIDAIFGVDIRGTLSKWMNSLTSYIMSWFPQSPVEQGPLTALSNVGESMIDLIFGDGVFSFAAEKMRQLGSTVMDTLSSMGEGVMNFLGFGGEEESKEKSASEMMLESAMITVQNATISGISGGEEQAAEVDVQSPNVATVDSDVATGPQRAAATSAPTQQPQQGQSETNEIRLDSSEDNVKQILRQILNTQKKFLKQLQNGNIAVYLDGRKVNKEIVRNPRFAN